LKKNDRHEAILKIIREQEVETQEDLAQELIVLGYAVTQATVSRDIRTLHLSKVPGNNGKFHYVAMKSETSNGSEERYLRVLKEAFHSMDTAGNLLVIKTVPGMAMAAAATFDGLGWSEVVGCIAGDDTIFCAIKTVEDVKGVMEKIKNIILQN
jgi:transcriptional regulator of arginine metabolism